MRAGPPWFKGPMMWDAEGRVWRRSSRCEASGCVEVAIGDDGVRVRDSSGPRERLLAVGREEWAAFLRWLKQAGGDPR